MRKLYQCYVCFKNLTEKDVTRIYGAPNMATKGEGRLELYICDLCSSK